MIHIQIHVYGIVQGVGFRPFVHRLAKTHHLTGTCFNSGEGVEIHVEGPQAEVHAFLHDLKHQAPALAQIQKITAQEGPVQNYSSFQILESHKGSRKTLIAPDIAPCQDCMRELLDPQDRRYRYPFINCTNCGPRYTIIQDIPYDRQNTTMSAFSLCPDCEKEYNDITNRRYHAQPNACNHCGPQLEYIGSATFKDPLDNALWDLQHGKIVAVKGIGGIHLACDARDPKAIRRLRQRKQREAKPLAIMVKDIETAKEFVVLNEKEEQFLSSKERPIVLCKKRDPQAYQELSHTKELGIFLPYSPLHILLLQTCTALVMTSANLQDMPVLIDNGEAKEKLKDIADAFLLHDRPIENRCDDSLMRIVSQEPYFIRRSRGYVPLPLPTQEDVTGILALGAHQKGSFALGKDHQAFLSPYIGNMENLETLAHYHKALKTMERLFSITPAVVACDRHPDYASTQYGQSLGLPLISIQHHHAHMASCMEDNQLHETCFGIIWDGTGLGEDQTIWGSEFLIGDQCSYQRCGSILPIALLGGEKAIHEIARIALALCWQAGKEISLLDPDKQKNLKKIWKHSSVFSSGMGRLLDGFYSLITKQTHQAYDGQAPVALENLAKPTSKTYPTAYQTKNNVRFFDWTWMLKTCLEDTDPKEYKAQKIHNTLIQMAIEQTCQLNPHHLPVILSGGCFQNQILLKGIINGLKKHGYRVYWHRRISCTDEGIALGQLAIAQKRM